MIGDDIPRLNDGKDDERIDRLQTFLECWGGLFILLGRLRMVRYPDGRR